MMTRTLNRRLSQLETRFKPADQPTTIEVVFVGPNKEVVSSLEVQIGGRQVGRRYEGQQSDTGERR